jgi:hypothetical protein
MARAGSEAGVGFDDTTHWSVVVVAYAAGDAASTSNGNRDIARHEIGLRSDQCKRIFGRRYGGHDCAAPWKKGACESPWVMVGPCTCDFGVRADCPRDRRNCIHGLRIDYSAWLVGSLARSFRLSAGMAGE